MQLVAGIERIAYEMTLLKDWVRILEDANVALSKR